MLSHHPTMLHDDVAGRLHRNPKPKVFIGNIIFSDANVSVLRNALAGWVSFCSKLCVLWSCCPACSTRSRECRLRHEVSDCSDRVPAVVSAIWTRHLNAWSSVSVNCHLLNVLTINRRMLARQRPSVALGWQGTNFLSLRGINV